jgi:hypothetical protein
LKISNFETMYQCHCEIALLPLTAKWDMDMKTRLNVESVFTDIESTPISRQNLFNACLMTETRLS